MLKGNTHVDRDEEMNYDEARVDDLGPDSRAKEASLEETVNHGMGLPENGAQGQVRLLKFK
jgi:hypothetical protein